ncbi:MAG: Rab family GTPase [Candidatus Asgardarchaeia archaeon]
MFKESAIKVILVGDGRVGKTSLVNTFSYSRFSSEYKMTIGATFASKDVYVNEKLVKLSIWDLAGQPRFNEVSRIFVKGARGVLYVFDLTREETLRNLTNWYSMVKREVGDIPNVVVGNKLDLALNTERLDSFAEKFAEKLGGRYIKTSAKHKKNVKEAFLTLVSLMFSTDDVKL